MGLRDSTIRVGDAVRVVVPRFVKRVGYPKSVDDYVEELRSKYSGALDALLREVLSHKGRALALRSWVPERVRTRMEQEVAYVMAKADGFGGKERTIHFEDRPEFEGKKFWVQGMRSVFTGTYYPPCYSPPSYDEMYGDYEPGGLSNPKCHRLVIICPGGFTTSWKKKSYLEIPTYNLEKVKT